MELIVEFASNGNLILLKSSALYVLKQDFLSRVRKFLMAHHNHVKIYFNKLQNRNMNYNMNTVCNVSCTNRLIEQSYQLAALWFVKSSSPVGIETQKLVCYNAQKRKFSPSKKKKYTKIQI